MNKQKAKQELSLLQSEFKDYTDDFKKRTEELERIINGSGFDWDFENNTYICYGDGEIVNGHDKSIKDYLLKNCFTTNNKKYAEQLAKIHALNSLLMQLAEHFNPEGWEPDWNDGDKSKYYIYFDHMGKKLGFYSTWSLHQPTIYFHQDVIKDVVSELENNRDKWVHLVGWSE